jgi:hypothetical protein
VSNEREVMLPCGKRWNKVSCFTCMDDSGLKKKLKIIEK